MTKARTVTQLFDAFDTDYSWRIQELSYIRSVVFKSDGNNRVAIITAGIPILYAHWEGFIKQAAISFTDYLSSQRYTYGQLSVSFAGLRAHHYVTVIADIKKMIFTPAVMLQSIRDIDTDRVNISLRPYLDSVGNLNFDLFKEIAEFLCLPISGYISYKPLIDESLLSSRNKVAHGEFVAIDRDDYEELMNNPLALMRMFKTDLENSTVSKGYLRA